MVRTVRIIENMDDEAKAGTGCAVFYPPENSYIIKKEGEIYEYSNHIRLYEPIHGRISARDGPLQRHQACRFLFPLFDGKDLLGF